MKRRDARHIRFRAAAAADGCGNNPLDDSVERAVWKTQPLPRGDRG